jgi:DNA-binding phage protein
VVNTVLKKALDDNDKDQVACLRMCIDRLLPMSYFEKEKGSGRNAVNITISGIGGSTVIESEGSSEDFEDVDYDEPRD